MARFSEVFEDVTKLGCKMPTTDYQTSGKYPIIDQGQESIAGYTDKADGLYTDVPAVIFGDHTRIVKYVDKPCFLGADGVKLLKPKHADADVKYLYYCLRNAKIPDTGYNRHFKWLKEIEIPLLPIDEQRRIAAVLDKAAALIDLRKQQLAKLDELVKARFVEMFGDPNDTNKLSANKHKIGELCDVTKLAGFEFTEYINYQDSGEVIMLRGLNCKQGKLVLNNVKYIDRETSLKLPRSRLYAGDILMTYAGTIGDVAMVDEDDKYHLAPNVAKISIVAKEKINPSFLVYLFMYSHDYIMTFASQVAQASINMQKIRDFEYNIPSMDEQIVFDAFAKQIDKSKAAIQKALDEAQLLFDSLMQKYFG